MLLMDVSSFVQLDMVTGVSPSFRANAPDAYYLHRCNLSFRVSKESGNFAKQSFFMPFFKNR
jgi:hypothetical protein